MKGLTQCIRLFTVTCLIYYGSASPASFFTDFDRNSTSLNEVLVNNTGFLHNQYKCWEPALLKNRRAKTLDCIRAAGLLPNLHDDALFHRGGGSSVDDPYSVPYVTVSGTCRVKVDVKYGRPDRSTWSVIKMALRFDVIDSCQLSLSGDRTGGQTSAGTGGRIMITAENVLWPESNVASA